MNPISRRAYLKTAGLLAASAAIPRRASANDRVVLGVMGIRDRGWDLTLEFGQRDDVEIRYLADPDSRLSSERAQKVEQLTGKRPQCVQDFRRMFDDKEVDAVAIATPDHWHALGTILACQAGKDVYVEKPTSHSIWESRKMVEAARRYDRVVQVGTQNRSADYVKEAIAYTKLPEFGAVHFVRVVNSKLREPTKVEVDTESPAGVDYDMWLGPAPSRKFNLNHFHYNWHWFWSYGGGDLANDGVHQIDIARWAIDRTLPKAVSSTGATYSLDDQRETPDTQTVTWEFDGVTMVLEQVLWTPYMRKTPLDLRDTNATPNWPFNGTRVEIYGEKRFMYLGRMGDGWAAFDEEGKQLFDKRGAYRATGTAHVANFIDCVKSRKRPNADIEDGHFSTLLAHYGNAAYRTGRRLHIDTRTEGFLNDDEANALYKRKYREPWVVPDAV
jgi:predicted dehydrogenase